MIFFNILKKLTSVLALVMLAINIVVVTATGARAADDIKLTCRAPFTTAAIDLRTLGITLSSAVPIGTVVYEGSATVDVQCGINILTTWPEEGLSTEVYFKRLSIAEGSLGYGLTLYLGYGGEYSNEAGTIATGQMVDKYAGITTGGVLNNYTEFTLNVPYKIVRTSSSLTAAPRTTLNLFQIGSLVTGSDEAFIASNLRNNAITVKDETCSVAGNTTQQVPLGSYSVSKSGGLGAGIGQTSNPIPFDIQLNCESLLSGTFEVMMQFDGDAVSGLSDAGVVALNTTSTATGVGVQILNENQQPVALASPFNVASYPLSAALITVPLYARYYQTAEKVSPGTADAVATYTLSYQ